nr:transcriptional adapter 3 [Hymenolepis microstoma]
MRHHSRSKKAMNDAAAYAIEHSAVDIPNQCQILHQLLESGEVNLLDLPRLQTELERILAANTQRLICISRHLRGEPMPDPVLRSLGLMEPDPDNQPQHPLETARLKQAKSEESSSSCFRASTNPDNPLSIIISNKKDQPLDVEIESQNAGQIDKEKTSKSIAPSPLPSPCEIPNRFWALMEPYCADITESNISYLEGILKSYVEDATASKYFQLPQSKFPKDTDHISSKRLRRDTSTKSEAGVCNNDDAEASTNCSQFSEALKSATEMVTLARRVDTQLKEMKPASSPSVESLLGSLEKKLYDDNVTSVLRGAVAHMAHESGFCVF